jgi:ribosomal protein S18 acetylase RimI-like enzyme
MKIFELTEYKDIFLDAVNKLLPQLSTSAVSLSKYDLQKIIASNSTKLLLTENQKLLVGTLTLVLFKIPTGTRALIEDVVVDSDARGQGIGKLLIQHAIKLAKESGAKTIDLTSHPSREPANRLYQKLGFEIRETNVYRYKI